MRELDVAIVGAGPAGMSAAVWAHTLKLRHAVLDAGDAPGGQLRRAFDRIVDYPGIAEAKDGAELATRFVRHLDSLGIHVWRGAAVTRIDVASCTVETAAAGRVAARFLILATGVRPRKLAVPGEADVVGRGMSPSAAKYADRFRGERVLVIGGGDAAFEEAIILAEGCEHVTLAHRGERFRARADFRDRVRAHPRIRLLTNTRLEAIEGDERVERAQLRGPEERFAVDVAGVFVCVGVVPNAEFVAGQLDLDDRGYIRTDVRQGTSADRVYAAGDVCSGSSFTIAAAVGQGAAAVKDVQRRLSAGL
jgi:thioredoxin reductase (NADPH)